MSNDVHISQTYTVVPTQVDTAAFRVSQAFTVDVFKNLADYRISQVFATFFYSNPGALFRASQVFSTGVISPVGTTFHVSQCFVTFVIASEDLSMPAVYPELLVGFSVIKRPIGSWSVAQSTSGAEVRVNYWNAPIWEWDLTYEYLPDTDSRNGVTASDLKTLMGFYTSTSCGFLPFYFNDPDDNQVFNQPVGTGDGTTVSFNLYRTYGIDEYTTSEPVGCVNTNQPFNVYLNGVLQVTNTYTLVTTTPVGSYIRFNTAPTPGALITCDMSYYYYVRFADPKYDFEKFMDKLWSTKKITLRSLRN